MPLSLRQLANDLRRDFPPRRGHVSVRQKRSPLRGPQCYWHGSTWRLEGGDFLIEINRAAPTASQKETLLHEWAHVLTFSSCLHHGARWAAEYARLVRWFQEEVEYARPE